MTIDKPNGRFVRSRSKTRMPQDAADKLKAAIADYKQAYKNDPRFRKVNAELDSIVRAIGYMEPDKGGDSPGQRTAKEASLGRPRAAQEQVRQTAPEAPRTAIN